MWIFDFIFFGAQILYDYALRCVVSNGAESKGVKA